MTQDALRPLPILTTTGELPTGFALDLLRRAKIATGYSGMVLPAVALPGSPEPILAVGCEPSWLTRYAHVPDLSDLDRVTAALTAILIEPDDPRLGDEVDLLSKWFKGPVKFLGTEEYVEPRSKQPDVRTGGWNR